MSAGQYGARQGARGYTGTKYDTVVSRRLSSRIMLEC